ncbi:DUF4153 domain-containing protein [Streptomyces sp. NPDC059166]|uniref:DUF4153 domain-containing protein n=1 Tax=Streptomyces sp. NPDC059166 TaxID=3346752 RepID=UPI0036A212A4
MSDQQSDASGTPDEPEREAAAALGARATKDGPAPGARAVGEATTAGRDRASTPPVPPQDAGPEVPEVPAYARRPQQGDVWQRKPQERQPGLSARLRNPSPPGVLPGTLWAVLATALLSALLLGDGLGVNALIVAVPAALAASFAARSAGRVLRPWTAVWAMGGLALLVVPALRDAGWPVFLALVSAIALGSLALHGSRSWPGVLLGSFGLFTSAAGGVRWGWQGVRERTGGSRGRLRTAVRTTVVAVVLLLVFGGLFASADAAFADLLGDLTPDLSVGEAPWRVFLFLLGAAGALSAAYSAAAPVRWDRITVRPGTSRSRAEWAVPLIVLNLLFAAFIALQLAVLLGGYDKVLEETGMLPAEYARQGFWQLLWATVLTLLVIALALRWAPRGAPGDRNLVRGVLGTLCLLTLVVVASALRRMDLYVDAFGLTRLRISVAAVELWLGVVLVLILAAGILGARMLPRAIAVSAAAGVLAFGLISPDGLIAEQNVQRYGSHGTIDIDYLKGLSADAVPALDELPEPLRSCTLENFQRELAVHETPWYATSWGEARARDILEERPARNQGTDCYRIGPEVDDRDGVEGESTYDPY